jgi:uncharacterized protein YkwD
MLEKTLMNTTPNRWTTAIAALAAACALVACGGGGGTAEPTAAASTPILLPSTATPTPVTDPGAPASVGNVAIDGRNWINFRRSQIGMPLLTQNTVIDSASQAHSDYQRLNDTITHAEIAGKPGFSGVDLLARLTTAGYAFARNSYAYGEVISATSSNSGFYMAEELITAIYHRFVIFEPVFKEIGAGSGTTAKNYTYFTADFTANNGYGPGIGRGALVTWPYNGQTQVTPNFFSDYEEPDPVPEKNEVGYPVSVHADITAVLTVKTFTIRPHGGNDLVTKQILHYSDEAETVPVAAAIVPLEPLRAATTYDVSFTGSVSGTTVEKTWSFTTK